jgi:hypothetical protein
MGAQVPIQQVDGVGQIPAQGAGHPLFGLDAGELAVERIGKGAGDRLRADGNVIRIQVAGIQQVSEGLGQFVQGSGAAIPDGFHDHGRVHRLFQGFVRHDPQLIDIEIQGVTGQQRRLGPAGARIAPFEVLAKVFHQAALARPGEIGGIQQGRLFQGGRRLGTLGVQLCPRLASWRRTRPRRAAGRRSPRPPEGGRSRRPTLVGGRSRGCCLGGCPGIP